MPRQADQSPSPRPYEIGTGTGRTAPDPDTTIPEDRWEKIKDKIAAGLKPLECKPSCITCGQPEDRGVCTPRCATLCACNRVEKPPRKDGTPPHARHRTHLCLIRVRATARLAKGRDGRRLLIVGNCPHCHRTHIHSADPAVGPYRRSGCGRPYLLEIT